MKKRLQKADKIITAIILTITAVCIVYTIFAVSLSESRSFLGYKPLIVLSNSMQGVFEAGDIIIIKETDPSELKAGDIIAFTSGGPENQNETVTHKIRSVNWNYFITYGTATEADDPEPVPFENVIGKYIFRIPKVGYIFEFLKSPLGYLILILIPALGFLIYHIIKFSKAAKKIKSEKQKNSLKQQLTEQRLKLQKAEQEIQRLKETEKRESIDRLIAELSEEINSSEQNKR